MLRGLFIGIDRYRPPVTRLSCARADAVALGSLFADNSAAADVKFLVDDQATASNIIGAIQSLATATDDDLVIISFSGHGTDDHRLVPIDVNVSDLAGTCIALSTLASLLDAIPSRQLIVILDCCFSGGFGGARVFAPTATRATIEDRQSVERLVRGAGRMVLTASGNAEPALESAAFGHGLFSHHLIEALQGFGDYSTKDLIPLLALLDYVTTRVTDSARSLGSIQTPTIYGSIEGAPALPRLIPGATYAAAFPHRVRLPAAKDWKSLEQFGYSQAVIDRWASRMPALNELQLKAVNDYGVLDGSSLVVVAPTSSGKTMIGELAAIREAEAGSRAVMLLPMRALVNEKYDYFSGLYSDHLTVVRATGEHADQLESIYNGQYDLALLTYEKFLNILTASPWIMRGVSLVVVDEAQIISDPSRGPNIEFLLALLRSGHGRGSPPQIVALSAVIGDTNGFERWLDAGLLIATERPIPLRESIIDESGRARHYHPDGSDSVETFIRPAWGVGGRGNKPIIIPLVSRLVSEGKKVIVFRAYKNDTVGTALYLSQSLGLAAASSVSSLLPEGGDPSTTSSELRAALTGGVGFHNADLDATERFALETRFREKDSDLRVIVATTTLAMGVNTPAEAVVIAGLTHPGPNPYSVSEYKNMVGRAGRVGYAEDGESYIVATGDPAPSQAWQRYVLGQPEPIVSHFLSATTDPQTLVLRSLVALGGTAPLEELIAILENSFAIWQRVDAGGDGWSRQRLEQDVAALSSAELVDVEPDGRITVTELGRYAGESGLEVRSVTQVSSLLRFLPANAVVTEADLVALAQVTVELDFYFPVARRSRQEQFRWPQSVASMGVNGSLMRGFHVGGGEPLSRSKKTAAALLFMSDLPMTNIESILMQHLPNRAAAGPVRSVAARTRDVIDAVITICRVRGYQLADEATLAHLGVRLEIGLPPQMGEVALQLGARLTRAQYLVLAGRGLTSFEAIGNGANDLSSLVGDDLAQEILQLIQARRLTH
ncbi:DEAD/DEAH box helicase [Mycobacterium hackensackense]|uniref:DEAD/DEAH box helicase n=1 Tax=Mycobacterium hackensackense TaxID=228909 RepID=UPI0022658813|nr:DEAD/DEAH box helicase [Mycobacterium hackensackense]MCV7251621.1 DEAD/DEAH box helicase [Mycobacterium hackensackense]